LKEREKEKEKERKLMKDLSLYVFNEAKSLIDSNILSTSSLTTDSLLAALDK